MYLDCFVTYVPDRSDRSAAHFQQTSNAAGLISRHFGQDRSFAWLCFIPLILGLYLRPNLLGIRQLVFEPFYWEVYDIAARARLKNRKPPCNLPAEADGEK